MLRALMLEVRRNKILAGACILFVLYSLVAALGPLALRDPNAQDLNATLQPPSREYLLGSDQFGRDLLSRLATATRISMTVGLGVVALSAAVGVSAGIVAGYFSKFLDSLLMRVSDVMMAFPSLILALALIAVLGPGLQSVIIALSVAYAPIYARIARGSVLVIKREAYVEAARTMGVRTVPLIGRHVLPNVAGPVLVQSALTFAFSILSESGLSFVGLGVPPPTASYGNVIASGRDYIFQASWIVTSAGLAIVGIVLALLVLADGLRDVVDPYQHASVTSPAEKVEAGGHL